VARGKEEASHPVFEPLVRGGSFNFQLPLRGGGSFCVTTGSDTHLT